MKNERKSWANTDPFLAGILSSERGVVPLGIADGERAGVHSGEHAVVHRGVRHLPLRTGDGSWRRQIERGSQGPGGFERGGKTAVRAVVEKVANTGGNLRVGGQAAETLHERRLFPNSKPGESSEHRWTSSLTWPCIDPVP